MRLQKHKTRKEKNYHKYVIVIPSKIVDKSGLNEGDELEAETNKKGEIILKRKK